MSRLLENLNPEQKEAVEHTNGPLLIVAGAGTGKTHLLTTKIAYLIEKEYARPEEILALTFTDKAAGEMEERVDRLLPYGYLDLSISTFHSFCEKILKNHGVEIGLPDFKLLSATEQWMMVRENMEKFNLDYYRPMGNPTKFIHSLLTHFSRAKDELITSEEYLECAKKCQLDGDSKEIIEEEKKKIIETANAYNVYNQLLLEKGALDFGDLISYALKLFKSRALLLNEYRKKFKYMLVDEFQDTNFAQYELVKLLALPNNNLTVVGDDDQSIYRFRGASMSNILTFNKDYKEAKKVVLIKNYRSGQKILDTSYEFIKQNNPNRLEIQLEEGLSKKLESQVKSLGTVEMIKEESLEVEVATVIKKILELKEIDESITWNDFAILVRANDSAKPFIHQAELLGIPYQFLAFRGLYGKTVITWVISFIKLLDNYRESSAMYNILNMPNWEIDVYKIVDINYHAKKKTISLYEACKNIELYVKDNDLAQKIKKIVNLIDKLREDARDKKPSQVIYKFLQESGLLTYLTGLADGTEKRNNFNYINKFYKKIKTFERDDSSIRIRDFLSLLELELEAGEQGSLPIDPNEGPEMIKILTVHSAKGLEFKYVFVVSLVDKRFPSTERKETIELPKELIKEIIPEGDLHMEEERRLFYVAVTRAKEKLFLTWSLDYGGVRPKKPSRFLYEMGFVEPTAKEKSSKESEHYLYPEDSSWQNIDTGDGVVKHILPKHYSYSQLKAFKSCPYQYYLRFILKIPTEDGFQASFGRSIHNTLYNFFIKLKELTNLNKSDLFLNKKSSEQVFPEIKILEEIYNKEWIGDWYESQKDMEKHKLQGWIALKKYYEKIKNDPPKSIYLEQEFTLKFNGDPFRGVIDRIDDNNDKTINIIDYKTGTPPKNDKLSFADKEQLLLYHLAAKEIMGLDIKELILYYIIEDKEYRFKAEEKDLQKIKEDTIKTIEQIKQLYFKASPGEFICKYCDYNSICPFKK